jgi:hypothetical protein
MTRSYLVCLGAAVLAFGCGGGSSGNAPAKMSGGTGGGTGGKASTGSGTGGGQSTGGQPSTKGNDAGMQSYHFAPIDGGTIAMPEISFQVPAFSSNANAGDAKNANDGIKNTMWASDKVPGWLAYDVSGAPADERQKGLVVINGWRSSDFITTSPQSYAMLPEDYVI